MQIDCYGFEATSEFFRRKELPAHLVKTIDGATYACFAATGRRAIHRIDADGEGNVRHMWAFGEWERCEDLAYVPVNETLEIERKEEG